MKTEHVVVGGDPSSPANHYSQSCLVSVMGWGTATLLWDLATGEVCAEYDITPLFRCNVQPGERKDFCNVVGEVGIVVERQQSGEIVFTFCLGGILQGHVEVCLNGHAEVTGGMVMLLQHPIDEAAEVLAEDPLSLAESYPDRACTFSIGGKSGRIDWNCAYGIFWFHFDGQDFSEFNSTEFIRGETRVQNGFSVNYQAAGEFVQFRLSIKDDSWLEISILDTIRHSSHFEVGPAPVEL